VDPSSPHSPEAPAPAPPPEPVSAEFVPAEPPRAEVNPAAPPIDPPARKGSLWFVLILLGLFVPGMLLQAAALLPGLAWTQVFSFLLPTVAAAEGSNLRAGAWLHLTLRPRLAQLGLAMGVGLAGFFAGGGLMSLWMLALPRSLIETMDVSRLFEGSPAQRAGLALMASLLAPVCEEITFRGYVLSALRTRFSPPRAIVLAAILFAAMHLDPVRFPALVMLGILFGWLTWRSGSVWTAVVAHATNNALASAIASVASLSRLDTESSPEIPASLAFLAMGAAVLWPVVRAFRRATPEPPVLDVAALRRDPADSDLRFRLRRVPSAIWSLASVGLLLLGVIGWSSAKGVWSGGSAHPLGGKAAQHRKAAQEPGVGAGDPVQSPVRPEHRGQGGRVHRRRDLR